VAEALGLTVVPHFSNAGCGANQKTCFLIARSGCMAA
jgi:hypothetical protein